MCRRPAGVPDPAGHERDLPAHHLLRGARHLPAGGTRLGWHRRPAVSLLLYFVFNPKRCGF